MQKAPPSLSRYLVVLFLLGSVLASGAIEVTTLTDEDDGTTNPATGNGTSLREAIKYSVPGVLITFASGLGGGVIALDAALGDLTIDKGLAIDASGLVGGMTIDGGSNGDLVADPGETRCFLISDNNPIVEIPVFLKDLTIRNGVVAGFDGGGNIENLEDLTLDNCIVTGGRAIGTGTNGGGISSSEGSLTLTNCTVSHNESAGDDTIGGGIASVGADLTLTGCTISHNRVSGNFATGGGIFSNTDLTTRVATLTNCTLYGNFASDIGGGYFNVNGLTRFNHCTVTGNETLPGQGGGIASFGDTVTRTELAATIVRDNIASELDFVVQSTNSFLSMGDNLVGAGSGIDGSTFTASGDQTGTATPALLAPFGDYGGGTLTMPPLPTSPAIDAASSSALTAGQRGVSRPLDGNLDTTAVSDIGAVEAGAPLIVDTLTDEDDGPGTGDGTSLRDAIGLVDDTRQAIIFDAGLNGGTISLTLWQLSIDQALIIDASALLDGIAIDGRSNGDFVEDFGETRCFRINDGSFLTEKPVLFRFLTIQNGVVGISSSGGANIQSYEDLTLDHCTIAHGRAIGTDSPVGGGDGGGICALDGSLTMIGCTVSHNIAFGTNATGGGLFTSLVPLEFVDCTIAHNHAVGENTFGGGVYSQTNLPAFGPVATLVNCTLHGNSATYAGGAYYNGQGLSRLIHCTVSGNEVPDGLGGGIASEGGPGNLTELTATIVRDNFSTDVDSILGFNTFASLGHNLVGTGGAIDGSTFNQPGDMTGTTLPALLAPLGDYGGLTSTRPPLPGSPAIDGAGPGSLGADQRGVGRPIDGDGDTTAVSDIGAVEVGTPILVDTVIDENDGPGGGTGNSLRDAIALADEARQTIIFAPILDGLGIDLTLGEIVIGQPLIIDASDLSLGITIDGGSNGDLVADPGETRCFRVTDGEPATTRAVVIKNMTIRNGVYDGPNAGANIHNNEDLTLEGCTIAHGRALGSAASGGGIYCFPGNLTLNDCVILDNQASGNGARGGGIASFGSDSFIALNGCAVIHNQADTNGGGIHSAGGFLSLTGSIVSHNQVGNEGSAGGGICTGFGTHLNVTGCTVSHNQVVGAFAKGGGIESFGNVMVTDSAIFRNRVMGNFAVGGGIRNAGNLDDQIALLTNCTIHRNTATYRGGGYDNAGGLSQFVHCTITENKAMSGKGAGISSIADALTRTELTSTIVRDNLSSDVDIDLGSTNSFVSLGGNLVGSGSGIDGSTFIVAGDQAGTASPVLLAPLGDYGGPTLTRHPLAGSPAFDGGGVTEIPVDQRGLPRSVGSPDIGAVEAAPVIVVDHVGDHAGTATTLRNAIATAIAGGSPTVLRFDRAVFDGEPGDAINLATGELMIPDGLLLFIDASINVGGVTISGTGGLRIFNVNEGGNLGVHSLTLRDGVGAVFNEGSLTLGHSLLINNTSSTDGAGVLSSGRLIAVSTTFKDNVAIGTGGGVSVSEPTSQTTLAECLFTGNEAGLGGAIMVFNGEAEIENTTITGNTGTAGAGIALQGDGGVTLTHCTVATNNSGGILIPGGTPSLILENTIVAGNLGTNLSGSAVFLGNNLLAGDPYLAPLGEYGGPTRSRPPLPGSPAIEGGILLGSTPPVDLLGHCRPGGPRPDLGSVEAVLFGKLGLASNDGDTIPDILEGPGTSYPHLDPSGDDSGVDSDGDGSPDAEEIGNMTDLNNPNDLLRILSITPAAAYVSGTNPLFDVVVTTFPGLAYSLENDQNLTAPFTPLGPPANAIDFTTSFQILLTPDHDFVRARRH